jgi:hypothetical protein
MFQFTQGSGLLPPTHGPYEAKLFSVTYELLTFDTAPSSTAHKLSISPLNSVHVYSGVDDGRTNGVLRKHTQKFVHVAFLLEKTIGLPFIKRFFNWRFRVLTAVIMGCNAV